jgi:GalNAc-alpha-(1->4)-GalNAc-alpha-(1->3)-diNAcBac-PP-undecaprenol alpha-1,4-N-acetyl-D-galactosaminyltransferase
MSMGCGGTERVITRLSEYFIERRVRVAVLSIADQGEDFFALPKQVLRFRLGSSGEEEGKLEKILGHLMMVLRLRRILKNLSAHNLVAFLPVPNVLLLLASIGLCRKKIICERNNPYLQRDLNLGWKILRKLTYSFADKITVNCDAAEEFCEPFRKHAEIIRISNPPMPNATKVNALANQVILYVGRIVYQKGIDILLAAVSQAQCLRRGWTLVLVGEGNEKVHLREMAEELGLGGAVFWKDSTSSITDEYHKAGIVVLPSRYEGTSNTVLEALAMGLPVLTTQAGGGDAVKDGFNGIVIDELSARVLARALDQFTSNRDLRRRLTHNCARQMGSDVFIKEMAEWENLFDIPIPNSQDL